jgi:hypothetical protein
LSSEAQLGQARGGLGVDVSAISNSKYLFKNGSGVVVGDDGPDTSIADYSLARTKFEKTAADDYYKILVNNNQGAVVSCPDVKYDSNNIMQVACQSNFTGICTIGSKKFFEQSFSNATAVQNCSNMTFAAGKSYMLKVEIMVKPNSLSNIAHNEFISFHVRIHRNYTTDAIELSDLYDNTYNSGAPAALISNYSFNQENGVANSQRLSITPDSGNSYGIDIRCIFQLFTF